MFVIGMTDFNPVEPPVDETPNPGEESSFGAILQEFEQQQAPAAEAPEGGVLQGTVAGISDDGWFVDLGGKSEGLLSKSSLPAGMQEPEVGSAVKVTVVGRTPEGQLLLSPLKVERPKDWTSLQAAFADKTNIGGRVIETVKGGVRVDIGGIRAFMPASRSGARDAIELAKLVGTEIECRVLTLDTEKEDVVVDRRVILEEAAAKAKEEAFARLQEGMVITGRVRSVTDFGAFLDLGGVDGLLHITDMSWHRVGKPADVVSIGQELEVKILRIAPNSKKVSVGLKQLQADPWSLVAEKFSVGQKVRGKVARLTDFGAFVELEAGIDGLVHISEMSWAKRVRKPSDLLNVGDEVEVVILDIKPADKKIQLSLKQTLGDPFEEAKGKYPVGSVVEAPVTSVQAFGAFIDLGNGIEGMVHVGDMVNDRRIDHPKDVVKVGDVVKAQVLEFDKERRRIRLGMKQLLPTKVDNFIEEHQVGETLSGRVAEVRGSLVKVEVSEGVFGEYRLPEEKKSAESKAAAGNVDVSALGAMLKARWKEGKGEGGGKENVLKPGQIRSFKVASMDAATKKIILELL